MSDENKNTQDLNKTNDTTPTEVNQANNPTDGAKSDTKPDTLQFTQDALNAMMAKEKSSGKRAIMKQFGLSDEKDLPDAITKFNAYLEAEKSKETDSDRLKNLSVELDKLNNEYTAALAKVTEYEKCDVLRSHGLTDAEEIEIYGIRISKLVTDEKDFAQAAAEYFKAHPKQERPPEFHVGAGKKEILKDKLDPITEAFRKGAGLKKKE